MKEREREKSKNPTKHSTYQSQSSMDVLRKVPGNATAPETVAAPRKPPRPLQRRRLRGESRRRRRRPEVGVMLWGAGRGTRIIMVLWDNHEGFIMSV